MRSAGLKPMPGIIFLLATVLFASVLSLRISLAETAAPAAQPETPPATPASPPAPASPPSAAPAPSAPDVKASPDTKGTSDTKGVPGVPDDATAQMLQIPSRPVAFLRGKSDWENGFKSIQKSINTIESEVNKAALKQGGKPIAVFVETDDTGFGYEAMIPLTEKPEGKDQLGSDVKLGSSPAGKAIKFQHRGAYDDIDATYDLITTYLDEKGLEAQNLFIEEYLTDTKNSDDQGLQVDIYVFIK